MVLLSYLMLYKRYKWMIFLGSILTIITLSANIVLISMSSWFLSASAIASLSGNIYIFNFMLPAVVMRSISITRTVGRYFDRLINHDITLRVLQHLRVFVFSKLLPLSPAGLIYFHQGELLNIIIADVDTLDNLYLKVVLPIVGALFTVLLLTIGLNFLNSQLAMISNIIILSTIFFLPFIFYHASKGIGEQLVYFRGDYRKRITMWLQSQAELNIFGANNFHRLQIKKVELAWYKAQRNQFKLLTLSQMLIQLVGRITVIGILWISFNSINNNINYFGPFISLFVFCIIATFEILALIISSFNYLKQAIVSYSRIVKITNQKPQIIFGNKITTVPSSVTLQVNRIHFSYDNQFSSTLKNISFYVPKYTRVAILGRTGCGKSTLLQLLTRAWNPQSGSILINNIPITEFSEETLRKTISIVPQRVYLFSATLRDNLVFSIPTVKDDILMNVLEQVGLHKTLLKNNEGLNNWLGEGGRQLSFGELRRLAIARALLHNAPLMLLDEPTVGLDSASEVQIIDLLDRLTKEKTVLMVTHRLFRLDNFDQIIVMDGGKIIDIVNQEILLTKYKHYCHY